MIKKVALLGFYVGDDYFERYSKGDAFPQVAAFKLEKRFLDALRIGGAKVATVASIAVSTYPRNKRIVFPGGSFIDDVGATGVIKPLINLPLLKVFVRLFGSFFGLVTQKKAGLDAVCVYAAHTPNLLAAYVFSKLYNVPFFVYIPDLPSYMDMGMNRSALLRALKKIDACIIDFLVSASSGVFVISRHMVDDNATWIGKPYLVLEGIASSGENLVTPVSPPDENKKYIFYAGGLNRAYGIVELVEGFIKSGVDCELWLCGRGELESYVKDVSVRYPSVKYLGFLSVSDVERIQGEASCLALTRNPDQRYTRYSFPSKLLEYLVSGVPVLTTRLTGVPDEYYQFLNVIDDASVEGVSNALRTFFAVDQHFLLEKAACAKIWVLENKSSTAVGRKIIDFMEKNN